jgi:ribosome-associated heat shock protein Hsp15
MERVRIDKWLWAARFVKTRSLAVDELHKGRVLVNEAVAKPSRELKVGDHIVLRIGQEQRSLHVTALSERRGPASEAALLYQEDQASIDRRRQAAEQRRLAPEPAISRGSERPTKRERRATEQLHKQSWNDRWTASLD